MGLDQYIFHVTKTHYDGIIYTCCGGVVFFNDVELVNRINMGEEVWPPVKY